MKKTVRTFEEAEAIARELAKANADTGLEDLKKGAQFAAELDDIAHSKYATADHIISDKEAEKIHRQREKYKKQLKAKHSQKDHIDILEEVFKDVVFEAEDDSQDDNRWTVSDALKWTAFTVYYNTLLELSMKNQTKKGE